MKKIFEDYIKTKEGIRVRVQTFDKDKTFIASFQPIDETQYEGRIKVEKYDPQTATRVQVHKCRRRSAKETRIAIKATKGYYGYALGILGLKPHVVQTGQTGRGVGHSL